MATRRQLEDRILGSVVGASVGDAMGGAFEQVTAEYVQRRLGDDWIDEVCDYRGHVYGPFGVWSRRAPAGTGTDDTRMNHIFIETVIECRGQITSQALAGEYIRRYLHPERYYPKRVLEPARRHLRNFYPVSCGHLGMSCPEYAGVPVGVLRDKSFGCRFPTLIGLLSLACAGGLFDNDALAAYRKAYELAYFDVGYAKEACALHAAAVSMAVGGIGNVGAIIRRVSRLDPFGFADSRFGRSLCEAVRQAGRLARKARDGRHLVELLSRELASVHIFDPVDTLTVSFAANRFADGDARQAITIAVNHRDIDEEGKLVRFRDNDCTGYVAGALAGALCGCKQLPAAWVERVITANRRMYGIDIERNVGEFCNAVYNSGR